MTFFKKIKFYIKDNIFISRYKDTFVRNLRDGSKLLDVGCGNNSPFEIKSLKPGIHYTGIDIENYNQSKPNLADSYIVCTPEYFHHELSKFNSFFDAIISAHNLEHVNYPDQTLMAMLKALKKGGVIFLSFPSEQSVNFPSRQGTLNYHDDSSHNNEPPVFSNIITLMLNNNFEILFSSKRYRPLYSWLRGFFNEFRSRKNKKIYSGTWAYYGFETIIWARKK